MATTLVNGRVLTPQGFADDKAVVLDEDRIAGVCAADDAPKGGERIDLSGGFLLPGFIDVQVNGGGGVLFNDDPSVEAIAAIGAAHRRFGTTGFLPTLISDELDVIAHAIEATRRSMDKGVPGVLGVHIEGPFLNAARKGAHDSRKFRKLDEQAFALLTSLGRGRTLVTLAPEETTPQMIARLVKAGIVVSAGHTNATYAEARAAIDAGLSGFTHVFNAMSPLASRAPGAVGAALERNDTWCGIIVDGLHVDPVVLRIALNAKAHEKFMLVTDAMPTVGAAQSTFALQGRTISVKEGALIAPDGVLAGSNLDMAQAVRNAVAMLGIDLEEAARMAALHPAQFLGAADLGRIEPGARANLVLLDEKLEVTNTWIDGVVD